ncbi:hypothetical protein KO494_03850 [Lacinutrix sp. C3R15]|uniref:DUF6799 domain-containing protein n=1 Tax=Flavobacteriaceae TaxID=49546 RepID=UPI001C08D9B1|nr:MULTISPECIES: DUF6799 domain-containing protein [Flavobacteriaceae]MBU2938668.1 hypothetical protein [Lacinutrix sp. C3R15]MDO6621982.1 hypothetical protein [Oceanihabitans sp. 1_MG-2023]
MKSLFLLIFVFLSSGNLLAQEQQKIEDANYCIFIDGKIFKQQNGEIARLETNFRLNNGTIIYPNGSYRLKNEDKFFLKEGECIGFSGKVYKSQEALNEVLYKKYKKLRK